MDDFLKSIKERLNVTKSEVEILTEAFAQIGIPFTIDREPRIFQNKISFTTIVLKNHIAFYFDKDERFISYECL